MAVKEPRQAIVSIRLSDDEQERLRKIADREGRTVSEVVRGFVHSEMADPLPQGESRPVISTPRPGRVGEGIFWATGDGVTAEGATLTVDLLDE